jgi:hypothetical protein
MSRASLLNALAGGVVVALMGCGAPFGLALQGCEKDTDCSSGGRCFVNRCTVPSQDFIAEVTGQSVAGEYAQDIVISQLSERQDFTLKAVSLLGEFRRDLEFPSVATQRVAFREMVQLRAEGQSELLVGARRSHSWIIAGSESAFYSVSASSGVFDLTAYSSNLEIPPEIVRNVRLVGSSPANVNFVFSSVAGIVPLQGRLLKTKAATGIPEVTLTDEVEIQAFDSERKTPLSQKILISKRGDFSLNLHPSVREQKQIVLSVTRVRAEAMIPNKDFTLSVPFSSTVVLEFGESLGPPLSVRGTVLGDDNSPVGNAHVQAWVRTGGGALFRSAVVVTDGQGKYQLDLLTGNETAITVFPPDDSVFASTSKSVSIVAGNAGPSIETLTLSKKIQVQGQLLLPDGSPATAVDVRAMEEVSAAPGAGTSFGAPVALVSTKTDEQGRFVLLLEPRTWRIQCAATKTAASTTALVTLQAGTAVQPLSLTLPEGARVVGTVVGEKQRPVKHATIRFFRRGFQGDQAPSILVGETVADENGEYAVILPKAISAK